MPKHAKSKLSKLESYVSLFGADCLTTDGAVPFCKVYDKAVNSDKKYYVLQHMKTSLHQERQKRRTGSTPQQGSLLTKYTVAPEKSNEFSMDLCRMMLQSNIALYKTQCSSFRKFLQKWTKQPVPHHSTLRKYYLKPTYDEVIRRIQDSIGDSKIWVSVDETTDAKGQFVVHTVVGSLDGSKASIPYVLNSEVVESTNHATIAQAFCDALNILWPDGLKHDRVLLFVSDAASYMKKAAEGLKILVPKMVFITCIAHGIHRVCEEIRKAFPDVDSFMGNVKKKFRKAPSRIQAFRELAPGLSLRRTARVQRIRLL
ncbi:uncharacterized protein LOC108864783 [Galendromus occidentalis]|uniref:Uncharacterized protein LOC108864783 n=1 Tax=Galendromus occidentalis TaxID=34638 RepID=A0AAJ7L7J9_9ACAR|nr:uncharacterized protein LOC108864783 [Galendromus occidentalis]